MEPHLKEALGIVKAQASVRHMTEEEIVNMLRSLSEGIKKVSEGVEVSEEEEPHPLVADPLKAIREKSVTCLECGKKFKILTKRHLATHGLTPKEYKEKYGYKKTLSLVAKGLARERRNKMRDMKLWEKRKKK
ncbi:MAG: MucR family transcriptional regulator [Desulfovibrio sp.]|uniref:MucR family transcriptional regulator n=1 Tax=Desulfovibrio sp. 7SRBS1 TaxID=3378064 RepID=UPI003B3DE04B